MQEKLMEMVTEVEPVTTAVNALWREIANTPLEYFLEKVLEKVEPPECLVVEELSEKGMKRLKVHFGKKKKKKKEMTETTKTNRIEPLKKVKERKVKLNFDKLEDVRDQLSAVMGHLQSAGGKYANVVKHIQVIVSSYKRFIERKQQAIEKASSGGRDQETESSKISILGRGTFLLKEELAARIIPLDTHGNLIKTNQQGIHKVCLSFSLVA